MGLSPYRRAHADVRWLEPESWHLTLVFLGSVGTDHVPALESIVTDAARESTPFAVRASRGGGRLPRRRDGVAWLALDEGAAPLIRLADRVADPCAEQLVDGPAPRRTPSAHLTLARRADHAVIDALRNQSLGDLAIAWPADRIRLMRSHLGRGGSVYETLLEVPFTRAPQGP